MAGQPVNLVFPVKGLSKNNPYALPSEGTTPAALNVRPEDTIDHRVRGGRRGGLTKQSITAVDTTTPIQHLTSDTTVTNPALLDSYKIVRVQQTADGQTHDTSIVVGNEAGDSYTEVQVEPDGIYDYSPKPCCYDTDGNFYIAMEGASNYDYVRKYSASLVEQASVCVGQTAATSTLCALVYCSGWDLLACMLTTSNNTWTGATATANLFLIDPADMSIVAHHDIDGGDAIGGGLYAPGEGQLLWDSVNEQLIVITADHQTTYGGASGQADKNVFAFDEDLVIQWSYDTTEGTDYEARGGAVVDNVVYVPQNKANGAKQRLYQLNAETGVLIRYKEVPAVGGRNGDSQYKCSNCVVRSDGKVVMAYSCKGAGATEWSMELVCLEWNTGTSAWDVDWSYAKNSDVDNSVIVTEKLTLWLDSHDAVYVGETASATGDYNLWKNAGDALDVEVSVIKFTSLGTYAWYWDKNGPADTWRAYSAPNRPGWGMALREYTNEDRPISTTDYVFVQNGRIYNSSNTEYPDDSGLTPLITRVNDVQSTWAYQNIYFVDGTNSRCLVLFESAAAPWSIYYHESVDWASIVVSHGEGTLPADCRLICTYRGRVVLAAQAGDPHNWFMSAVNNPLDWDYAPATTVATQAVAGNNSTAGKVGDPITALIPYNDDLLIFGGIHSIHQLSGDPMDNGTIDLLTDKIGIRFGTAYCRDPQGVLYFFGTDGIYMLAPAEGGASQIKSITSGRLDNEWDAINWGQYRTQMQWDYARAGLLVALIPYDAALTTYMYFWSQQADSWWMDSYPASMGPSCMLAMSGESAAESRLVFGCRDGYIRYYDDAAETDDGTAITSYVDWVLPATPLDMQQAISHAQPIMGESSAAVTMQVFRGSTAQEVVNATTPAIARTLAAGRSMPLVHSISGRHLRVRLTSTGSRWAMEQLQLVMSIIGKGQKR